MRLIDTETVDVALDDIVDHLPDVLNPAQLAYLLFRLALAYGMNSQEFDELAPAISAGLAQNSRPN